MAAPVDAVNFANAMLNKLTVGGVGGDPTVGPYPEEGFRTGGRGSLASFHQEVITAFGQTRDVYERKLLEFAPQFFFNDTAPNRAKDNWSRDFEKLKSQALS